MFICRKHVQSKDTEVRTSLCVDIVTILEDMEAFTLKLLLDIVTNIAEVCWDLCMSGSRFHLQRKYFVPLVIKFLYFCKQSHLKHYFSKDNKQFFFLTEAVKSDFAKLANHQDVKEVSYKSDL